LIKKPSGDLIVTQIPMYPAQPDSPDFEVQVDITAGDTDITFIDLTGLLAAPNTLTIRQSDNPPDTTPETVYYATDPTGDTLTVTRGYGGTVAKDFTAGALACRAHTAYDLNTFRSNIGDIVSTISGLAVDTAVFHKATAGEINALTLKATPAGTDVLMIEDSAGSTFDKKKIAISTLPFQTVLTNPVIGLATPFVSGDVITGTGTGNQVQDSGVLLSSLATLLNPTFTGTPAAPTAPNGTQTTQIATTEFVQNAISYLDPLLYKGTIDCSTNPNYPAADTGNLYIASVSGKIGGASGKAVRVGDMILCNHDGTASGDEAAVGIYWNAIQANMGAVIGPASSTDGHFMVWDGASGKAAKDSGVAFETDPTNIKMNGTQALGASGHVPDAAHVHPTDTSRAAATALGTWADHAITPVWSVATPTIASTVARYVRNGNVVSLAVTINITDGKDAVLGSLDLPVAASQIVGHQVPLSSFKLYSDGVDDVVSDPFAYVDYNEATPVIKLRAGGSFPDGNTAVLNIAGSYEVPT
jgi:hypothetical protein